MLPLISENNEQDRVIFSEYFGPRNFFMAKYRNVKYVYYSDGHSQLFDLETDPNELVNLSDDLRYSEIKQRLHQEIQALPEPWRNHERY
jgi:arylsulfatase A-like enzyme